MCIGFNLPSCNSFLFQMADTSMIILPQDLLRISFLVQQAALQVKVFSSGLFSRSNHLIFDRSIILFISFELWFYDILVIFFCQSNRSCWNSVPDTFASLPDKPGSLLAWRQFCIITACLDYYAVWLVWNWCETK